MLKILKLEINYAILGSNLKIQGIFMMLMFYNIVWNFIRVVKVFPVANVTDDEIRNKVIREQSIYGDIKILENVYESDKRYESKRVCNHTILHSLFNFPFVKLC